MGITSLLMKGIGEMISILLIFMNAIINRHALGRICLSVPLDTLEIFVIHVESTMGFGILESQIMYVLNA
jgi:hypothetical protein